MNKTFNRFMMAWLSLTYIFLFVPIVVIIVMSFNKTDYGLFPYVFTTDWYTYLFSKSELLPATELSIIFSLIIALFSIILGTLTALGLQQMSKKMAVHFNQTLQLPIIIPWLVQGIAMLLILNLAGIGRSYLGMFLGNLIVVLPYVVLLVSGRFNEADRTPEEAARILGAKPLRVFWDVTVPLIFPGMLAGGLMSFMVCFNSFCIQYYLAPFGVRTLPMEIFTLVRNGYKPDLNALAALLIVITVAIVLVLNKLGYSAKRIFS